MNEKTNVSNNKKIIAGVGIVLAVVLGIVVWKFSSPKQEKPVEEPVIVFNENIVFELGEEIQKEALSTQIINKSQSKFDEVLSFEGIDTSSVTVSSPVNENEQSYSVSIDNQSGYATELNNNLFTVDDGTNKKTYDLSKFPNIEILLTADGNIVEKTTNKNLDEFLKVDAAVDNKPRKASVKVKLGKTEKTFEFSYDVKDTRS